ncbi:MAG: hypothetical protein NWE93_09775 [Candidatus Bathyarchaeota archaeon]|nr:hypothetical protein [Candidatus Bathyarchaeota archaeon]
MSEKSSTQNLQEQIEIVEKIVRKTPLRMFVTGVVGTAFLAVFMIFGQPLAMVGGGIFGGCVGLLVFYERKAREEFEKLLKQLHYRETLEK